LVQAESARTEATAITNLNPTFLRIRNTPH
jgi:hypothetical protein